MASAISANWIRAGDPLLLAAGELARVGVALVVQADAAQQLRPGRTSLVADVAGGDVEVDAQIEATISSGITWKMLA